MEFLGKFAILRCKLTNAKNYDAINSNIFRDFYNWTMTFRRDSDVIDSYGPFVAKVGETPGLSSYTYKLNPMGILKSL